MTESARRAGFTIRLTSDDTGGRLADVVHPWLQSVLGAHLSRSTVRRLIIAGAVRVDGLVLRVPGAEVRGGSRLEALVDLRRIPVAPDLMPLPPLAILHEDEDVIAVNKPSGIPTVPTADPRRASVVTLLKDMLAQRGDEGADAAYLGVHQRLDAETSGVVLFARRREANAWLARAFAERGVQKVYLALTARPRRLPPRAWSADQPINAGQAARTDFVLAQAMPGALLVEARPLTGRKHQVRIHLSVSELPILGDRRHGGQTRCCGLAVPRVMLHASRLTVPRPSGSVLDLQAPLPADFRLLLARLGEMRRLAGDGALAR